jgi:prepilin-type N-terminal cleavage/methylation domain-containing protein
MNLIELKNELRLNQGFTLVELVIAIVVLAVLVGIAVPLYSHVTRTAADRAHNANVRQIKGAVQMASFKYTPPSSSADERDTLWGEANRDATDADSVNWPEGGWGYYLQDWPEVPRQSRAYGNDLQTQGTEYVVFIEPGGLLTIHPPPLDGVTETAGSNDPAFRLSYDFADPSSFQGFCQLVVSSNCNTWSFEDAFYFNHTAPNGTVFMPNDLDEYTVTTRASLSPGTTGGFGIFFDTTAETNGLNDNGFIFQFDRGMGEGQFIVRPRVDGVEGNRVASFASRNLAGIPTKEEDPQWWSSPREVSVKVSNVGTNQRKAEFYIDGINIGSYSYEKQLTENEQYYTGLRGWHAKSKYYSFELE